MENFINEVIKGEKVELLIDNNIFPKEIILKAAYNFLDVVYFFFKRDVNGNIIVQFTKRKNNDEDIKDILSNFSDELISVVLREKLEKDNKEIRETIVGTAIGNSLDSGNFVSLGGETQEQNQIDFDKDIDDILKEIESDPDLKIDEDEIEGILKEIEDEENKVEENGVLKVNPEAVKKAKDTFNKK